MVDQKITLTVQEAVQHEDIGRDIARMSWDAMERLGLSRGDSIEIEGLRKTYAIVYPVSTSWNDALFIDGNIRRRAGIGIKEQAIVKRVEAKSGKKVTFQIISDTSVSDIAQVATYLKENLENEYVYPGKMYKIPIGQQQTEPVYELFRSLGGFGGGFGNYGYTTYLVVAVTKTEPDGPVSISSDTKLSVTDEKERERANASGQSTTHEKGESGSYIPDIHYEDIGGLDRELSLVREVIELPLRNPELFERLGIEPPKGVLLYGPPGTGKTMIAKAVASEVNAHFISLSGPEIMNKYYGESEGKLREIFEEAEKHAPSIIFIDEIDSIAPKREETKGEVERRIVAQLLTLMDGLKSRGRVIVIGATNLSDNLDPALRRGGRFDREIEVGIPDIAGRLAIFQIHTRNVPLALSGITIKDEELKNAEKNQLYRVENEIENINNKIKSKAEDDKNNGNKHDKELKSLHEQKREVENSIRRRLFLEPFAERAHGLVGADISLVVKEAAMHALRRALEKVNPKDVKEGKIDQKLISGIVVTPDDFQYGMMHVEPSAMREVLIEVPDTTWDDIGGMEAIKREVQEAIEWPLKYPQVFSHLNVKAPKGILLFGAPGTGKTLIAKAVAHESECNFISVKGPELMSKWVGESEKGIRDIFRKARQAAPSIIFFDEIDALLPKRGSYMSSAHVTESVVSQILTEIDGIEALHDVTIIAATNRADMIDEAVLRAGRIEQHIYVRPPDAIGRKQIFDVYLTDADLLLTSDVNVDELVERTGGYVGADIEALVREAKRAAMREFIRLMEGRNSQEINEAVPNLRVTKAHFEEAFTRVRASLNREARETYEQQAWQILYSSEECELLEDARNIIAYCRTNVEHNTSYKELSHLVYEADTKDFKAIRSLVEKIKTT
ncbi:MAG: CDC48 family AAA ATPase [Methanomicrobiales archaeon]|jgi:transitional endoplasmic reticulum ATPase|nr:CDC48 family AAA ATPase [Methanomicrobiales archaeon]